MFFQLVIVKGHLGTIATFSSLEMWPFLSGQFFKKFAQTDIQVLKKTNEHINSDEKFLKEHQTPKSYDQKGTTK